MCNPHSLLHHNYFPHLFEAIVDASDFNTLLAYRQTSRSLRDRIDNLLARHLVLTDDVRTVKGRRMPSFSPYSTQRPTVRLLDVHADPSPDVKLALQSTRLLTVRVYGHIQRGSFHCRTLVLHSLHQLPPATCVRTLVLNVPATDYAHFVTTAMGKCLTLVVPSDLKVVFLDGLQRRKIRIITIEEWERETGPQSSILQLANWSNERCQT